VHMPYGRHPDASGNNRRSDYSHFRAVDTLSNALLADLAARVPTALRGIRPGVDPAGLARSCSICVVRAGDAQVFKPGPVRSRSVRCMAHRAGDGRFSCRCRAGSARFRAGPWP
jgi:hypothetical protein